MSEYLALQHDTVWEEEQVLTGAGAELVLAGGAVLGLGAGFASASAAGMAMTVVDVMARARAAMRVLNCIFVVGGWG